MQNLKEFLQGKKTYISAALIALVAIVGWWTNAVDNTQALAMLGVAGVSAGLGAKSERVAETILAVLGDLRQAQARSAAGQKVDPQQLAAEIAKHIGAQVIPGIVPISIPGAGGADAVKK